MMITMTTTATSATSAGVAMPPVPRLLMPSIDNDDGDNCCYSWTCHEKCICHGRVFWRDCSDLACIRLRMGAQHFGCCNSAVMTMVAVVRVVIYCYSLVEV